MNNPQTNYEMTEQDCEELLDSCKSVPYIIVGGIGPSSPQERANNAWARLGKKMGFDSMSVRPIHGKGNRFFTAVPSETQEQQEKRRVKAEQERKASEIARLESEISERIKRLLELTESNP